jgi:hypothetical protein
MSKEETQALPRPVLAPRLARDDLTRLGGPGMRTFRRIADEWGLSEERRIALLGYPGRSTYQQWARKAREGRDLSLPFDTLMRVSALLGIYKALAILFERPDDRLAWLKSSAAVLDFGDLPPLDVMVDGGLDGLMRVRRRLDAARGGFLGPPDPAFDTDPPMLADDDIVII